MIKGGVEMLKKLNEWPAAKMRQCRAKKIRPHPSPRGTWRASPPAEGDIFAALGGLESPTEKAAPGQKPVKCSAVGHFVFWTGVEQR
jgi:hypothetical protein